MEQLPERHLECSECKKPIAYVYTEIVGKMIYRLSMCADCPILQQKLRGITGTIVDAGEKAGLLCGGCNTTAEEIKRGGSLGCPLCYEVFEELIVAELQSQGRLQQKVAGVRKNMPLHLGRAPESSDRLLADVAQHQ